MKVVGASSSRPCCHPIHPHMSRRGCPSPPRAGRQSVTRSGRGDVALMAPSDTPALAERLWLDATMTDWAALATRTGREHALWQQPNIRRRLLDRPRITSGATFAIRNGIHSHYAALPLLTEIAEQSSSRFCRCARSGVRHCRFDDDHAIPGCSPTLGAARWVHDLARRNLPWLPMTPRSLIWLQALLALRTGACRRNRRRRR